MIFSNPPLVELIAELRWAPAGLPPGVGGVQFPLISPYVEETFSRFTNGIAEKGFGQSERLVPVGFPYIPFSVVYRFRKPPAQREKFLYQIGPGVFSANALPPYRDWDSFRPIVQDGIQALLNSRHPSENSDITQVTLRYIDLFSNEFTEGKSSFGFINEVMGIRLELPRTLTDQALDPAGIKSGIQLSIPLRNDLRMNLSLGDGIVASKTGIVMTTEVSKTLPTPPHPGRIMETLEAAHAHIRETFMGLTERLHNKMGVSAQ